jgi:hypothetical protein
MDHTKSYFVYSPPKSNSHGHGVRDKNVIRATQKVIDCFVSSFNATTDNKLQLTLHYDKNSELQKASKTIEKLNEFLGPSQREWNNIGYEHMENTITWEVLKISIIDLLKYTEKIKDDSFLPLTKYRISSSYHYRNNNEASGFIMCFIELGRLFVGLHLVIPHSIDDKKCFEFLNEFQKCLPFKLNSKHFRRLGPSKRGYGQWKLDEDTQKRLDLCLIESKIK